MNDKPETPDPSQPGKWCTPGGGVEFGESLALALCREFKEETGLEILAISSPIAIEEVQNDGKHAVLIFYQVSVIGSSNPAKVDAADGHTEAGWFDINWIQSIARKAKLLQLIQRHKQILANAP